ncbi:MAG: Holliday junction resolvase [Theionarchaea archaeon]|nr:Holliday junction resolvase [Theionarchaea archaeon]MBU6999212.1 Holliday junction resolvase [Theionarchaea archaeon]MBU7019663.1 Holliday junction resolvase [Theionarchaea archaeon]MBU7034584.1 Holliday junction resolvase [Theionarchaea archaeon]
MYNKGRRAERFLVEKLWDLEYAAIRVPGSGRSYKRPHPDIVAGNGKKYLAFQVKSTSNERKYFTQKEIADLKEFCSVFGSSPAIAVKFSRSLRLFRPEDLTPTEKGYKADSSQGKTLEEFLHDNTTGNRG